MKKRHEKWLQAFFGYGLMTLGFLAVIYSFWLFFVMRQFTAGELTTSVAASAVLMTLGYYISTGKEIKLPFQSS